MKAIMEAQLLVSALPDETEDFSEWRLFLGVARFDHVEVNRGFQIRDFQTAQGTSIIVDPTTYRKLQNETNSIWTTLSRKKAVVRVVFGFLFLSWLHILQQYRVAILLGSAVYPVIILSLSLAYAIIKAAAQYLQKNADSRTIVVVDSYKQHFLKAYGIELGYGMLNRSAQGDPKFLVPAIYLRRRRRLVEEEVLTAGDFEVQQDEGQMPPPIFIRCTFPGDIHVNEKGHDASMKVDAETWALLQSVHQKMVQTPPIVGFLWMFYDVFLCYCSFRVGQEFMAENRHVFVLLVILCFSIPVTYRIIDGALDHQNLRVYQEVTRRVNEALQKDANRSHLAVEFQTTDLPDRGKTSCRRYQFVKSNQIPETIREFPWWPLGRIGDSRKDT